MNKPFFILFGTVILLSCQSKKNTSSFSYPETRQDTVTDNYFGIVIQDAYRWLEDDNSEETKKWVENQNKVTFDYLGKIPFREKIKERLTELWNYEKFSAPFKKGDNYFFFKNDGIQNQSVLYIQSTLDAEPEVLIDPNTFSEDGTIALGGVYIDKKADFLAYSIAKSGSDWNEIHVMDLKTKELLPDTIHWVKFSGISWHKNGFYYSRYDKPEKGKEYSEKNSFHKVCYHKLGTKQSQDKLVYEDKNNPKIIVNAFATEDENYLVISTSESTSGNQLAIIDLNTKKEIKLTENFSNDYNVIDNIGSKFYIHTNDEAPRYRLIEIDVKSPERNNWKNILPQKLEVLESVEITNENIYAQYMKDVSNELLKYDLSGKNEIKITLPAVGIIGSFSSNKNDSLAFFTFTNYNTPISVYKLSTQNNTIELFKKPTLNFDSEQLTTKQVFYESKDGTKIPLFITHKKDIVLDGNNPTFLYGYGGFNISITPSFSINRAVFLENGGIYAVANIRGGGEYGKAWHEQGTQLKKQNVFDDFIAAAEYLIAEKYTNAQKLAIHGRSNGGLLIGAVMTQRPDLFKVALPAVGVLDMLRYHKFTIGYAWATDYGTSDEEVHFSNLIKYSPLHNVKENAYPATMILTADHDDRVVPAHSFKFAAELQTKQKGENSVLIRVDTNAGHGSGKPVSKQIDEYADLWAFVFYNLGMNVK